MIAVDVGGERYRLVFWHQQPTQWDHGSTEAKMQRINGDGWETVQAGRAVCSADDAYVKETGRRIALRRLYAKLCPPTQRAGMASESTHARAMRRLMRAYFDRPRGRR